MRVGNEELVLNEYRVSVSKMKKALEMDGGNGCITVWIYLIPLNCILTNG